MESRLSSFLHAYYTGILVMYISYIAQCTHNNVHKLYMCTTIGSFTYVHNYSSPSYRWANVSLSENILRKLLPGQLTAVFTRKKSLNSCLNPDTSLVGIRIPNHKFIRDLVRNCSCPIALTSANKSGSESTLEIRVSTVYMHTIIVYACLGNTIFVGYSPWL